MNNAFGHIPEDLLQQAQEAWDFKTCQRSDGTTYGTAGDCAQKGAKEVKKGSKKSSWDPGDNLSGKMGTEVARVAGPAATSNTPGEAAVGRALDAANYGSHRVNEALDKFRAGQISGKKFGSILKQERLKTYQQAVKGMTAANEMVASGEAGTNYARRISKEFEQYYSSYTKPYNLAVKRGMITPGQVPTIPKPGQKPKPSSGGGGRASNADVLKAFEDLGKLYGGVGALEGTSMAGMVPKRGSGQYMGQNKFGQHIEAKQAPLAGKTMYHAYAGNQWINSYQTLSEAMNGGQSVGVGAPVGNISGGSQYIRR